MRRLMVLLTVVLAAAGLAGPPAAADPELSVPLEDLDAALTCPDDFVNPAREPVLLVHGTGANPQENYGWNYLMVLPRLGFDVCTVRLPNRALDDMQVSSEYVVHAIREMARKAQGPVDVLGHSQGGLEPRWALKWWPGLQPLTDDVVELATPNHGVIVAEPWPRCTEACLQLRRSSIFLGALNAGDETPGTTSFTSIYSMTDGLVLPYDSPALDGASNILIQDVCPAKPVDHLGIVYDTAVFELVLDAFTHPGPADPARFDPAACRRPPFPGLDAIPRALGIAFFEITGGQERPPAIRLTDTEPPRAPYAAG